MSDIERLHDAILRLHKCDSVHLSTFHVREVFQGQVVWEGDVEEFKLSGEAGENDCYAWSESQHGGLERFFVVPKKPPVDSPGAAVRATVASESGIFRSKPGTPG
jgi:hypothetical protein